MERGRAVVGEEFAGELRVNGTCKAAGLFRIRLRRFAPDHVCAWRVSQAPGNGCIQPTAQHEESFDGSFPGEELAVIGIAVAGNALRGVSVSTGDDHRWNVKHVSSQAPSHHFLNRIAGGHEYLTAHV